ncbi:UTP--glucose-1-phosphate uridylyltransferase [Desulfovibrio inopinatus]|uniref:UTP--glucose-1-phosphate uridylyltransferase n=1 Tax=Desulfovibrio inopinatus TaxID=102109 RepID=UPI0003F661A9|nr:UTP--glucose-1-phosphate uridylyltransferase [Desulfovibrio inopinatus]
MRMSCIKAAETDMNISQMFKPFALKMEEQGMPSIVINVFKCYYSQYVYGAQGKLSDKEISPLKDEDVKSYLDLDDYAKAGRRSMHRVVIFKLNGGLGTSMGLEKAKSLIPVRGNKSFLDVIITQVKKLREMHKTMLPLVFMNSFKTHLDTMMLADKDGFDNGKTGIPLAFVQHRYPKILEEDYKPAQWPSNPELEWNPPGHGDFYTALVTSKVLKTCLENGYRYAFVSNSDNLGAIMDERVLGYMVEEEIPFAMEVARRTASDKKGGHLARLNKTGSLVLREVAQCPSNEIESFQDIEKYRYFNTNSLWLDLKELETVFIENRMMPLDMIINPKTVDPRNSSSPHVVQIETAMGSAISNFKRAKALGVPRLRFAPVKTTNDLLVVMSDCYLLTEEGTVIQNPERKKDLPIISLDSQYYKKIDDFFAKFPHGAPSLLQCDSLTIKGNVVFEKDVVIKGDVTLENTTSRPVVIKAGSELTGVVELV